MHHALEIQEIVFNIFGHCSRSPPGLPEGKDSQPLALRDLAALARTCRAFKEPALDLLWEDLPDLSPLARCLPGLTSPGIGTSSSSNIYAFCRPLKQEEWNSLRSYTHRVRSILRFSSGLDKDSAKLLWSCSVDDPLFPNLRRVQYYFDQENVYIPPHMRPITSVVSIHISHLSYRSSLTLQDRFRTQSLSEVFPNVEQFSYEGHGLVDSQCVLSCICVWRNLRKLYCRTIGLDMNVLASLSCLAMLTDLSFNTNAPEFVPYALNKPPLLFSNLRCLEIIVSNLASASHFFTSVQLPTITQLFVHGNDHNTSSGSFRTLLANVQTACIRHSLTWLSITDSFWGPAPTNRSHYPDRTFSLDYLRLLTWFGNLRKISITLHWNVTLSDNDLLEVVSTWPCLEAFCINAYSGWGTPGGITPNGLLRFLRACPSLRRFCLAIDSRCYTEHPPRLRTDTAMPPLDGINLIDSIIKKESIVAMASFLADIAPYPDFKFEHGLREERHPPSPIRALYRRRWGTVYSLANQAVRLRYRQNTHLASSYS